MRSKNLLAAALCSAVALTGAVAQTAAADSILYLKGGDVWLTEPDGSRQFQVTTTGGYSSASQADDGSIVALAGQRIHRLDRLGNVLADFSTAVSDGTADDPLPYASHFIGPHEVDLSPDGTKVAYNFHWQYWSTWGSTGYHMLRQGVGVSHADRTTSWEEPGLGVQTGWLDSSWYDDDTLLLGNKASAGMMDISLDDLGTQTSDSQDWFWYGTNLQNLRRPAVNRQHSMVAFVGDREGGEQLWVAKMTGEAPALPDGCHLYKQPTGGTFESPTWSPDGKGLAWQEGDGVYVSADQTCQAPGAHRLVIAGGEEPDWGPADVPSSRPQPPADGGTPGAGGTPGGAGTPGGRAAQGAGQPAGPAPAGPGAPAPAGTPGTSGSGSEQAPLAQAFGVGCRRACTVRGRVVLPAKLARRLGVGAGRAIATGTARRTRRGTVKLRLTPTAAGRKVLAKVKGERLTLKATIREGGRTRSLTRRVVLK